MKKIFAQKIFKEKILKQSKFFVPIKLNLNKYSYTQSVHNPQIDLYMVNIYIFFLQTSIQNPIPHHLSTSKNQKEIYKNYSFNKKKKFYSQNLLLI